MQLNRRNFLKWGGLGVSGLALPLANAANRTAQPAEKFGLPLAGSPGLATWYVRQWYGNTRWAYRQRRLLYAQGQGIHFGLDFYAPCGSTVTAIGDGTVAAVDGPYGSAPHNVVVRHPNGYASLYGHLLERSSLRPGQPIRRGEKIGLSGINTGSITGNTTGADCDTHPHLHLEIRTADLGGALNPVNLIEAPWPDMTLGLALEGMQFEVNLENPNRWQSIYDQPSIRFGGPLLNDYRQGWP